VHLGNTPEGIGILHLAAGDVRGEDLALLEQAQKIAGGRRLTDVRADAMADLPIGSVGSPKRLDGLGGGYVGCLADVLR
jgi:hypothetical protein